MRIIAAVFILLCHIGTAVGNGLVAQAFTVGVYFFFFISGYLYGNRLITNSIPWLGKKYLKIAIPVLVYVFTCAIVSSAIGLSVNWSSLPLYIFNVQGYYHLFEFLPPVTLINGTQHLWFLTVIFVCYALTILVQRINVPESIPTRIALVLFVVILSFLCSYFGARIDYILMYFIGYYFSKKYVKPRLFSIALSFGVMVLFVVARLLLKTYCDDNGDIPFYTQITIPLSLMAITVFFFFVLDFVVEWTKGFEVFKLFYSSRFLIFVGKLTFYVYITHYLFIDGGVSVFGLQYNIVIRILLFLLLSFASGFLLYGVDLFLNRLIFGSKRINRI